MVKDLRHGHRTAAGISVFVGGYHRHHQVIRFSLSPVAGDLRPLVAGELPRISLAGDIIPHTSAVIDIDIGNPTAAAIGRSGRIAGLAGIYHPVPFVGNGQSYRHTIIDIVAEQCHAQTGITRFGYLLESTAVGDTEDGRCAVVTRSKSKPLSVTETENVVNGRIRSAAPRIAGPAYRHDSRDAPYRSAPRLRVHAAEHGLHRRTGLIYVHIMAVGRKGFRYPLPVGLFFRAGNRQQCCTRCKNP